MEIRRSYDRLISTMGFPILVRRHLYIESVPWCWGRIFQENQANTVVADALTPCIDNTILDCVFSMQPFTRPHWSNSTLEIVRTETQWYLHENCGQWTVGRFRAPSTAESNLSGCKYHRCCSNPIILRAGDLRGKLLSVEVCNVLVSLNSLL